MARSGMTDLIDTLRGMTDAGTADYTIGTITYWGDDEVQKVLDRHRADFEWSNTRPIGDVTAGGSISYTRYLVGYENLESGTAVFKVQNTAGTVLGTSLYSVDCARGLITFGSTTLGSSIMVSGRSFDLNSAAADIWRVKASNAAKYVDFSTDNHRISKSQVLKNCLEMAAYYEGLSAPSSTEIVRGDMGCKERED